MELYLYINCTTTGQTLVRCFPLFGFATSLLGLGLVLSRALRGSIRERCRDLVYLLELPREPGRI
jgi:hypothetical protein